MEEQKGKVVEMQQKQKETERPEKMSYEQLENIAHQLSEQAKQLYMKLQAANMGNMFKRLDYLFKVVENGHMFKQDFLEKCIAEIEELMTVPEEVEEEEAPDIKTGLKMIAENIFSPSDTISARKVKTLMEKQNEEIFLATTESIQQRAAMVLTNVRYVIEAHFDMTDKANPSDNPGKFQEMMRRRLEKGQSYHQPCLDKAKLTFDFPQPGAEISPLESISS